MYNTTKSDNVIFLTFSFFLQWIFHISLFFKKIKYSKNKLKYYKGFVTDKGKVREGTKNKELFDLSSNSNDFKETDIIERKNLIICTFIDYLRRNDLLLK